MTAILGISALYHDSAAALLVDGEIVAAAQEERFTRKKHDDRFPVEAIEYCLAEAGLDPAQLDYVGFYDKPFRKFERLLETYLSYAPRGYKSFSTAIPTWLREKQRVARELDRALRGEFKKRYIFSEHHESHAASAFFPSPFEEAAIITLDGVGEWATAAYGTGRANRIHLTREMRFPHSLGLLYSAFTYFTGFKVNSGEYKLMGLAPYGEPVYRDLILEKILDLKPDGSFRMDMRYFNYCEGLTMTSKRFDELFGGPPRTPDERITQREMDIAASIQAVTEEIMLRMARHVHRETGLRNLCLAGGVALNCVGNGRILREGPFEDIWIQPAAGDAGGALGVAQLIWYQLLDNERTPQPADAQKGSLLGPFYADDEVETFLKSVNAAYERIDDDGELCERVARAIAGGKVVGWFQGRMEFGPRALGARSILGDARNTEMQSTINLKVKFREGFRPFAPVILREYAHEYFGMEPGHESPYMLLVAPVQDSKRRAVPPELANAQGIDKLRIERSEVPAITHVDYSARVQTADPTRHGIYRKLLETFHRMTGCPVLVNTSFNLGWDPIVCNPRDAYDTFMSSDIDSLCIGHFLVSKDSNLASISARDSAASDRVSRRLVSPCCGAELESSQESTLICGSCGHTFPVNDGIPRLVWPADDGRRSADQHDRVESDPDDPAPGSPYDGHATIRSFIDYMRRDPSALSLDRAIPYDCDVLEVGCGAGELANFLSISYRRVTATDPCAESLTLGRVFAAKHALHRVRFVQMNTLRPALPADQFHVIIYNGTTGSAVETREGFEAVLALLRPGGHIVARLPHRFAQPVKARNGRRYSAHTVGELLRWFSEAGLEFVRGVPALRPEDDGPSDAVLFNPQDPGTQIDRWVSQAGHALKSRRKDGGRFVMIARRPERLTETMRPADEDRTAESVSRPPQTAGVDR